MILIDYSAYHQPLVLSVAPGDLCDPVSSKTDVGLIFVGGISVVSLVNIDGYATTKKGVKTGLYQKQMREIWVRSYWMIDMYVLTGF